MEEFINLHNRTVSRSEVERVISIAKEQNNTEVIYRLSRILNAYPTEKRFVINIKDYPTPPTALAGAHHTGDYREALDDCGRLRKGYKFVKGKIIPPQPSHLSAPSHLSDDELTFLAAAGIDYFEQAPDDETQGLGKPIPAADIYKMITDKIIKMLKSTKASDYKKTWEDDAFFIPINFDSKKPYRGVNRMLLQERIGLTEAFANPYFLTFKQIKKHKGTLKKGAKGYEVVYYSIRYVVPADKNIGRKAYSSTNAHKVIDFLDKHKLPENIVTRIPMIRYYNVYNGEDITGIDFKLPEVKIGRAIPETASENEAAQLIVENYPNPPAIKHGGNEAYYKLSEDLVRMPKIEQFDSVNDYYRTLFHELTHSTRHESRLNREKISFRFGDSGYAKEELVAEFGAVFLSAWAGIMWYNNKNHAAYLKGWNSAIKEAENDNKFLMKAASLAQAATDYILNLNAAGQPAFLSKYEKPNKAEKPKKKAEKPKPKAPKETKTTTALKFSDTETNKKMIEGYRNSSTGKINLLKTDMIGTQFHLSMFEKYMAIDDIAALYGKGRKAEAQKDYAFVKERIEWAFNHNLRAAKEYDTIEQCTERFIELLPNLLAKGGQWLEAKANSKNSATAKGQFTKVIKQAFDEIGNVAVGEKPNKAEKPKPEAKKATEKTDNTDKKYKFIAFYNVLNEIVCLYSYQELTINEFYLKNTFDNGIKVYAPLRFYEKIEETKRKIEKQYTEGKDFICLTFESEKSEEYYSLLIHSNEKPKPEATKAKKNTKVGQYTGVKTIPLSDLYTDEKRFQNRKKLNEEIVENIVNNFKPTDLDPLVVWYDKKQGKTFVLAGHHRFEALKRLKHKNVPVKFANDDYPTEADAIRYAKEISNANRTLEEPYERAAIYRKYREEGYSEKEINDKAALEGKNRSYILNLSCLNPKGATMSTLVQFSQTQSKADKNEAERVADWIGQARRNAPELTDAHEKEMFDFLMNKEASKRTTTKVKFLEYVRACWNPFEPTAPLNLARMKYQSEGEKQYDEEVERYKTLISDLQNNIGNLKDRFINPANKDFVNPEAPDYMAVKKIADNKIAEYNTQIQYYQKELLKLYSNKQSYLKPTGQIALFGSLPIFKTLKEAKKYFKAWAYTHLRGKKVFHKELDKYVVFSSKGIDHVLSSKISLKKMYLIQQAEEMLKNSHLIAFVEDYKKRDNIKGAYRMRTTATFEGEEVKVILTLREGENGVVYYDHKIEEIEESTTPPRKSRANPFCGDSAPTNIPAKTVPNSLNAPRHAGILKEALTEKGKLKKGWYFQDYGIIDPKGKYHPLERDYSLEYNLIEKELRDRAFQQDEKRKIKGFEENKKLEEAINVYLKELSKENRKHFKNSKAMEVFYWAFPFTLESNSTFYTFEESNPYINKRLQELDQYFTDNNELFERLENYKTLRRYNLKSLGLHISAKISSFIDKQGKVIRGDSNKLNQKYGLSTPITTPNVYVEHLPEETNRQISTSANTLDAKMAALQHRQWETFVIANPQMQAFLGDVERKTSESTVITIAGGAGSGKTRFAFQFINALAQNYTVGHASLEEHPDSKLYYDKVQQYIDETALPNIDVPEIKDLDQLEALIRRNEVIVIDSFAKLQELNPRFLLDRDLRKKYDGKLFLLIYQLTGEGKMRGGSKSEYDGDIILLTHVAPDYRENYIYPSKNRYNALPATQLRYSTYFQQMLDIPQELGTGSQPTEAISLPPAPQTNVYEVIY
ncbi:MULTISPECIES: zincin-like metallopeptidase domain-containing protein [Capnocytophaga]|nr:zincin-like metallopeptidase domain-containing protein [Capnocytophaga sp. FDAARGOS_737]